ncbi:LCP family glycopolymer transferase [Paenibacillus profundus]|nr:LCP family protein [Paenibacillus profundus]
MMKQLWNRWRPWHKVAFVMFGTLLIAGTVGCITVWYMLKETADTMYEPLPSRERPSFLTSDGANSGRTDLPKLSAGSDADRNRAPLSVHDGGMPDLSAQDPFTLLLIGVDERDGDRGRSDTLAFVTVQPKRGTASILSIPRDTRTRIEGTSTEDKINHAYAFGGVLMTVATVEKLLQAPVHFYVKTNMDGFTAMIDAIDGVDVANAFDFDLDGAVFQQGNIHLSGSDALKFVRMRKQDPDGDFGRMSRQRQVLQAMLHKAGRLSSAASWGTLLDHVKRYVRTNIRFEQWSDLWLHYRSEINNVEHDTLQGKGAKIGGIYYLLVDDQERQRVRKNIYKNLDDTP